MNALRIIGTWLRHTITRWLQSLTGRLALTLAVLALVLLALEFGQHANRMRERQRVDDQRYSLSAAASADAIHVRLQDLFRAQGLLVRGMRRSPNAADYLEDIRLQYPGLEFLQVWTRGQASAVQATSSTYPAIPRPDLFMEASKHEDGRFVSNVEAIPTAPNRFFIRVVSLVKEPGPVAPIESLVLMEFDFTRFPQLFGGHERLGDEVLLDGRGVGIYTSGQVPTPDRLMAEPEIARAVHTRTAGRIQLDLGRAGDVNGYAQPVDRTPWTLLFLETQPPVAGIDPDIWSAILVPLLIVGVLGVALSLLMRISIRPVRRLTAAARMLGTGDLSLRLDKPEVEEFQELVSAFNAMAERLELIQSALVEANARLEEEKLALDERVRAATGELRDEHDRLLRAERLSTLGLFSSAIAHDLRNPLNTVSLSVEWLRMRLVDHPEERVRERLALLRRELQRADQIIRTLLGFARTGEPVLAPTDLNQLLQEIADVVEPPEGVRLDLQLDQTLPAVPVDRAQLFQVVENLVRNAIQAMPDGGEIRLASRANCDTCHVVVADTGPGIPLDVQERVFEPLVSSKTTGTGLGLALARRIVEAHHGQIRLVSAPGEGARFDIELPLHLEAESDGAAMTEQGGGRPAGGVEQRLPG